MQAIDSLKKFIKSNSYHVLASSAEARNKFRELISVLSKYEDGSHIIQSFIPFDINNGKSISIGFVEKAIEKNAFMILPSLIANFLEHTRFNPSVNQSDWRNILIDSKLEFPDKNTPVKLEFEPNHSVGKDKKTPENEQLFIAKFSIRGKMKVGHNADHSSNTEKLDLQYLQVQKEKFYVSKVLFLRQADWLQRTTVYGVGKTKSSLFTDDKRESENNLLLGKFPDYPQYILSNKTIGTDKSE
jgi:hypothetical protein